MTGHLHQPATLWHFTCNHAAPLIRKQGLILPGALQGPPSPEAMSQLNPYERQAVQEIRSFAWFTDLQPPAPRGPLGLTRQTISCDRLAFCFEVEPDYDDMRWWMYVRKEHPNLLDLELDPDAMPMHWFVSEKPVPVYREWDAQRGVPEDG
jgi:hypothetical protein